MARSGAAGPVGERAVGKLHGKQAVGTGLDGGGDFLLIHFREARDDRAEVFHGQPRDERGGGLLDAAVGIVEQEIDGTGGLDERGAGELEVDLAACRLAVVRRVGRGD